MFYVPVTACSASRATQLPPQARQRVLNFVEAIAKWSMADVFVVALFITFLAAKASQTAPGSTPLIAFHANFGPGFYWFTGYCLFSLASQQYTARLARGNCGAGARAAAD